MPDNVLSALEQALVLDKKALKDLLAFSAENQNFRSSILDLIKAIDSSQGHVILSGVGKSGYIAKCISSSFSSVGISSFFLHPTEAAHGELGAITSRNLLLLITKSGETAELRLLIKYAKKHAIKIAIITTSPSSALAKQSDIVLSVPLSKESGLFSSAPTTSSLLFLALANALITTIAQSKKISKETFFDIHPGGSIGKKCPASF
ncbi:SIS domain-containing protein [Acetobacteraceae bacterium]|nr:SIS domain-containing protein [Acetobacteraceae bacterium]